jgi:dTDP-L-rhamnose 4-epimerase
VADLDAGRFDPPCPQCGAQLTAVGIAEDAATDPRNVYAATKLAQEHLAASWARFTGGRLIALRYHNVYGPRSGELRAYNVGSGQVHTVGEMATALAAVYGGPAPVITGDYRRGDVRHTASSDRSARELGWRAVISFADGVAEFARDDHRDAVRPRG